MKMKNNKTETYGFYAVISNTFNLGDFVKLKEGHGTDPHRTIGSWLVVGLENKKGRVLYTIHHRTPSGGTAFAEYYEEVLELTTAEQNGRGTADEDEE